MVFFSRLLDDVEMQCEVNCCSLISIVTSHYIWELSSPDCQYIIMLYRSKSQAIDGWFGPPIHMISHVNSWLLTLPHFFQMRKKNQPRRHASHLSQGRRQREARADISFTSFALQGALTASMASTSTGNGQFWSGNSMEQWQTTWFAIVLPNSTAGGFE